MCVRVTCMFVLVYACTFIVSEEGRVSMWPWSELLVVGMPFCWASLKRSEWHLEVSSSYKTNAVFAQRLFTEVTGHSPRSRGRLGG